MTFPYRSTAYREGSYNLNKQTIGSAGWRGDNRSISCCSAHVYI